VADALFPWNPGRLPERRHGRRSVCMSASPTTAATVSSGPPDPYLFRIRDLVYKAAGIFQPDNKLKFLEDRCGRRMHELKLGTLREYLDRLNQPSAAREEMIKLLNEVTVGETCFFGTSRNWMRSSPSLGRASSPRAPAFPSRNCAFGARAAPPARSRTPWPSCCWKQALACSRGGLSASRPTT